MRRILEKTALAVICILIAAGVQLAFNRDAHAATVRPGWPSTTVTFSLSETRAIGGKREYFSIAAGACAVLPKVYAIACAASGGAALTWLGKRFAYARTYNCAVRLRFTSTLMPPYWNLSNVSVVNCPWQRVSGNGGGSW